MGLHVERTCELPWEELQPLVDQSAGEGWRHLERLCEEWRQGLNRFEKKGEGLYLARSRGRLLGVGGLSLDPYGGSPGIRRVRRLYVLAEHRRRGVGRALMDRLIQEGRRSCGELRLRAGSADAAAFFVALGFKSTQHLADSTHRLRLR